MAPLATGAHEIEQAVEQAAHVCGPRPPAGLSWRNERFDQAILVIAQSLARSKVADPSAIRGRPHCGLQTGKGSGGTLSTALVARQTNQHTLSKRALSFPWIIFHRLGFLFSFSFGAITQPLASVKSSFKSAT